MKPKFANGQKVKIISVIDPHGLPKYRELEKYDSRTGVIIDYFWSGVIPRPAASYFFYNVHLDKDGAEVNVWEDALEPLVN